MLKRKNQKGQALLIVLLSMAVVLTIVLSTLARSITDVSVSEQDKESLRAFSAAEAGVEQALIIGSSIDPTTLGNARYFVDVSAMAEGSTEIIYPSPFFSGESMTIWFVAHDDEDNYTCTAEKPCFTGRRMRVCWGKEGEDDSSSTTPAIEVTVFYTRTPGDYSTTEVVRKVVDPNSLRRSENNFDANGSGTCSISDKTYQFYKNVNFEVLGIPESVYTTQNGLQFAVIRFLYNTSNPSPLAISVNFSENTTLPSQGLQIESSGSSGDANRKINVFRFFSESAEPFQFGVFSLGGGLVK